MIAYAIATILGSCFVLFSHWLNAQGDTVINLVASLLLTMLLLFLLPEFRVLPVGAYLMAWLFSFIGFQFVLPWSAGKPFVWMWRFNTLRVAFANVAPG